MGESDTTVTIEKSHLATLMRRADLHTSGTEPSTFHEPHRDSVTVPRLYLEELKRSLREYTTLRNALLRGGVTPESLEVLIQEHHDVQVPAIDAFDTRLQYGQSAASLGAAVPLPGATHAKAPQINKDSAEVQHGYRNTGPTRGHTWSYHNTVPSQSPHEHGFDGLFNTGQKMSYKAPEQGDFGAERSHHGKRTLYLTKLPDNITYGKIFGVIRGGAVVDVWMKSSDHAASVSFVECSAAERFYQYSKKNDIYIDGRRIQVDWRDPSRQFVILNNIMSAISRGATRNLLLQKIPPNLSEARIREDLDHIHNLHVEKVEIRGSTAYVNLNSICVALFARTCLMSRSSYKGIKIEFAADDCSVSLPIAKRKPPMGPEKEQKVTPKNRFDILASVSGNEDEDSSDDETERENSDGDRRTAIGAEFGDSASFLNGINSYAWGDTVNGF